MLCLTFNFNLLCTLKERLSNILLLNSSLTVTTLTSVDPQRDISGVLL